MGQQIYFEDVSEGMELPVEVREPTTRQLVQYAGASGDFYEIHYDKPYAESIGLPGIIIHGALKNAMLGSYVTGWAGPEGTLRRLTCQYRGMDFPRRTHHGQGTRYPGVPGRRAKSRGLHHLAGEPAGSADHAGDGHGGAAQPRVTLQTVVSAEGTGFRLSPE